MSAHCPVIFLSGDEGKMEYLEIAKIVSTSGLKGEMRTVLWCDSVEFFKKVKNYYLGRENGSEKTEIKVLSARQQKNVMIIKIEGVDTVEKAHALIGKVIYINKEDVNLEEGRYFYSDLLGMSVIDENTGEDFGTVTDIAQTGANDIYEVTKGKRKAWIPAIKSVVKRIDIENKKMYITPIEGLF